MIPVLSACQVPSSDKVRTTWPCWKTANKINIIVEPLYNTAIFLQNTLEGEVWSVLREFIMGYPVVVNVSLCINTLKPRQNGRHFADDTFKPIFLNENIRIWNKISLKFIPKGPINNIPALVQIMPWRRTGDKPLSEPMMTQFSNAYMRHSASMS